MFRSAFMLVALVGYATAQLSISGDCQSAIANIVANSDAADCLGASSLVALALTSSSSQSLIPSIDNWLTNICSAPICSNATLAGVVQNISEGCASDLNSTNLNAATLTSDVEQFYPTVRQILCLKDGSTNCITQTLDNIQAAYGSINVTDVLSLIGLAGEVNTSSLSNITCTNCNKAIYNELNQTSALNSFATGLGPTLESECGPSFIDGATPSGIIESASNSTATPASSAAFGSISLLSHGIFTGLSGVIVISALITLR
jgi:hypothetical protein